MTRLMILSLMIFSVSLIAQTEDLTNVSFLDSHYHFGVITEGEVVQNVFQFTNDGDVPLVITSAKGSCGCTVPEYPRAPIMPGETAELLVRFNSKNKKGTQRKRITITANTDPQRTYLMLEGQIEPRTDADLELELNDKVEIAMPKAVKDVDATLLKLFPNPTIDRLQIDLTAYGSQQATIEIYDIKDQVLFSENDVDLSKTKEIDVSAFAGGSHVVSIKVPGMHRITKQFIIAK